MSKRFLSPLVIGSIRVLETEFAADQARPSGDLSLSISLDNPTPKIEKDSSNERYHSDVELTVAVTLLDKEGSAVGMHGLVRMIASLEVPTDIGDEEKALRYLRLNGISLLYAHARACFMTLVESSPMTGFILPPIDPVAYLDSIADGETE